MSLITDESARTFTRDRRAAAELESLGVIRRVEVGRSHALGRVEPPPVLSRLVLTRDR